MKFWNDALLQQRPIKFISRSVCFEGERQENEHLNCEYIFTYKVNKTIAIK